MFHVDLRVLWLSVLYLGHEALWVVHHSRLHGGVHLARVHAVLVLVVHLSRGVHLRGGILHAGVSATAFRHRLRVVHIHVPAVE